MSSRSSSDGVCRVNRADCLVATLALMLSVPTLARAQGPPDLSGLWTVDAAKSAPTELTLALGTRAAVYKLDGTENWSPSLKSTAKWDNAKLVVTWTREVYLGPKAGQGAFERQTGIDIYAVAGGVLTVDRTITTPRGTQTGTVVYTRSPE